MPVGTAPRRKVLVVSPSVRRRTDWSDVVDDGRTDIETCSGPRASCPLQSAGACALVAACDLALYDFEATPPTFLAELLRAHRAAEIVLVRDRMVRGQHRPSVVMRRRPRGTAFEPTF